MPKLVRLYGVYVYMYKRSNYGKGNRDEHENDPHIHLIYQGNEIKVNINDFSYEVEKGRLIPIMKDVAIEVIDKCKEDLLKMWKEQKFYKLKI
jgi:hypothetical protein